MSRCFNCPVNPALACPGTDVRRFCELVDPDHADYAPAYRVSLCSLAEGTAPGPYVPADRPTVPATAQPYAADGQTPCCGGTAYLGIDLT
jgi:hypothetical protein